MPSVTAIGSYEAKAKMASVGRLRYWLSFCPSLHISSKRMKANIACPLPWILPSDSISSVRFETMGIMLRTSASITPRFASSCMRSGSTATKSIPPIAPSTRRYWKSCQAGTALPSGNFALAAAAWTAVVRQLRRYSMCGRARITAISTLRAFSARTRAASRIESHTAAKAVPTVPIAVITFKKLTFASAPGRSRQSQPMVKPMINAANTTANQNPLSRQSIGSWLIFISRPQMVLLLAQRSYPTSIGVSAC